jgi:hypothetical protein
MNYFIIFFSGLVFLCITACDTQVQTEPPKKMTEASTADVKTTEIKTVPVVAPAKVTPEPKKVLPPLKLSIGDISLEDKKNNGTVFLNDSDRTEKNSALFDRLNKKGSESKKLNLSGEVLTDKNEVENQPLIQKVDGLQINVEAGFNQQ